MPRLRLLFLLSNKDGEHVLRRETEITFAASETTGYRSREGGTISVPRLRLLFLLSNKDGEHVLRRETEITFAAAARYFFCLLRVRSLSSISL